MNRMQVLIDVPEELVPATLRDALENLASSIKRLRRLKKLKKYQGEDLDTMLKDFDALKRTWKYYSVPSDHALIDDITLKDEDI